MPTFYRLTDRTGNVLGVCDSPDEAKRLADADIWDAVPDRDGDFDGWRADYSYYDRHNPHFRIRKIEA